MSDHAQLLRLAAQEIQRRVEDLPPGHATRWKAVTLEPNEFYEGEAWWVDTDINVTSVDGYRTDTTIAECSWSGQDAEYMALWDPLVALSIAEVLLAGAKDIDDGEDIDYGLVTMALTLLREKE